MTQTKTISSFELKPFGLSLSWLGVSVLVGAGVLGMIACCCQGCDQLIGS
jgi:hypothetical protein